MSNELEILSDPIESEIKLAGKSFHVRPLTIGALAGALKYKVSLFSIIDLNFFNIQADEIIPLLSILIGVPEKDLSNADLSEGIEAIMKIAEVNKQNFLKIKDISTKMSKKMNLSQEENQTQQSNGQEESKDSLNTDTQSKI